MKTEDTMLLQNIAAKLLSLHLAISINEIDNPFLKKHLAVSINRKHRIRSFREIKSMVFS